MVFIKLRKNSHPLKKIYLYKPTFDSFNALLFHEGGWTQFQYAIISSLLPAFNGTKLYYNVSVRVKEIPSNLHKI